MAWGNQASRGNCFENHSNPEHKKRLFTAGTVRYGIFRLLVSAQPRALHQHNGQQRRQQTD